VISCADGPLAGGPSGAGCVGGPLTGGPSKAEGAAVAARGANLFAAVVDATDEGTDRLVGSEGLDFDGAN